MLNERITENLTLKSFGNYKKFGFIVESQKSESERVNKLLQHASKSGFGKGYPDFIIRHQDDKDFLMVVECKSDVRALRSKTLDRYSDYAVDGALILKLSGQ